MLHQAFCCPLIQLRTFNWIPGAMYIWLLLWKLHSFYFFIWHQQYNFYRPINNRPFYSYYENISWHKYQTLFGKDLVSWLSLKNISKMMACHLLEVFLISSIGWDPYGVHKQKIPQDLAGEMRQVHKCL